jgi:hypothetical protein
MVRNVLGSVLALIAAAAAVLSPFRDWYDGRTGSDTRLRELFSGSGLTSAEADLFTGLFVPMLAVAVLAVVGVVFRSRLVVALAGVVALGFTVLWMVRQYQLADSLVIGSGGMSVGALGALAAGVLLLIASTLMAGRHRATVLAEPVPTRQGEREADHPTRSDTVVEGPWDKGTGGSWDDAERHRRDAA